MTIWETWNVCPACKDRAVRNMRQSYAVPMHGDYLRMLFELDALCGECGHQLC